MKKLMIATAFLLPFSAMSMTLDKNRLYMGGSYSNIDIQSDGVSVDLSTLSVVGGFRVNRFVALEGRFGQGQSKGNLAGAVVEVDRFVGLNLVGTYPLGDDNFRLYGSLGYNDIELTGSVPGSSISGSVDSVNYGLGISYVVGPLEYRIGYENFYDKDSVKADGYTITVNYTF
ncbi:porin family protein [Limnobacter sp.]|uniref:porin family protein n=1 Tax=Limnobacter sp. TaxID=2003368 RepID=UPI0027BA0D89|nr:porin family protein [Limnobacter sp.]